MSEERLHTGRCLCGAVTYVVSGEPVVVAHCHCEDCQRLTGSGHSTGAMFPAANLELEGSVAEFELTSDNGNQVTRVFCPSCGSPILGKNTGMQGFVTLTLGTMTDSGDLQPEVVVFTRNRRPWDFIDETLPSFEAQPVFNPDDS